MALDASGSEAAAELLARYAKGDAAAADELVARLTPVVWSVALRLLGEAGEADDVTQEAMLHVWHSAPSLAVASGPVSTWLYRVTVNLCIDRGRRPGGVLQDPPRPEGRRGALLVALAGLPIRQRAAVVLCDLEGLELDAAAEVLGLSAASVESLRERGWRGLSAALAARRMELGLADE